MSKEKLPKRSCKSSEKLNYESDLEFQKMAEQTHLFHYYDEKENYLYPYFEMPGNIVELENAQENPDFFLRELYWTPNHPPYDLHIKHQNWQLSLMTKYFNEVFEKHSFENGHQPSHKFYNVILSKTKDHEIMKCIKEYELLPVRDLIFEVISHAQNYVVENIEYWEQPEQQKDLSSFEKDMQKIFTVLDKFEKITPEHRNIKSKRADKLESIFFKYQNNTVKIENKWIINEIITKFKNYYDNQQHKNWRLDFPLYLDQFNENLKKNQFKYNLANSLYNLLTNTEFFPVTKSIPTPNPLMLCIAKILEFSLFPIAGADELDEIKIKHIRNWLNRKDLKTTATFAKITPDKVRLRKYFDEAFINLPNDIKRVDAINIGNFLGRRFDIKCLKLDLIHIVQALIIGNGFRGHQMYIVGKPKTPPFEEFENFEKLIKGVNSNQKITSLKFKIEGDDKEYELMQHLPLYFIKEGIKNYSDQNLVEINTELVKTKITKTEEDTFIIEKENRFAQPNERFIIQFVKAFYDYLVAEAPITENYSSSASKYYAIIALTLQKTLFFYNERDTEEFIIKKVKQWHMLSIK